MRISWANRRTGGCGGSPDGAVKRRGAGAPDGAVKRRGEGAIFHFSRISHLNPADLSGNRRRHDSGGCGNRKNFIFASYCLNAKFLHRNYFIRLTHIPYVLRLTRPFQRCATGISGMSERLLGNFVAIVSGTYTIWLPELVRYSVFLPNRTFGSGRNILLKIFFRFRTL